MLGAAKAESHGAVTIVNAMATGKGAALGIKLWTRATVTPTNQKGTFIARNLTNPEEDTGLAEVAARRVFSRFGAHKRLGAIVETESNIPIAVGLKSSSAASNAVTLASLRAIGKKVSDLQAIKLGVNASLQAGVTLTGAYDDASACYFGGLVVTDNMKRKILRKFKPKTGFSVLIHIPKTKRYTRDIDPKPLEVIKSFVQAAHQEALRGNYWNSMTLNGFAYSMALGYETNSTTLALNAGAIAAGLTGKGPAVVAIVPEAKLPPVRAAWRHLKGRVIESSFNFERAWSARLSR
jgi:shikimate kinase